MVRYCIGPIGLLKIDPSLIIKERGGGEEGARERKREKSKTLFYRECSLTLERERGRERETDRQADRQRERQRQTDRDREVPELKDWS